MNVAIGMLLLAGLVLPPAAVPLAWYVLRRRHIRRPVVFLLWTCSIAGLLYWVLAFPLGILLWWLTPQYGGGIISMPHFWAAQALLTVPLLWAMARAEHAA